MSEFDSVSMVPRLINSSKIKYSVLDEILKGLVIPEDTVNLYIDGYYIFYKLYKADYSVDIYKTDMDRFIRETVISFLNTIAHYRRYLVTRMRKTNRIVVVFNRRPPKYQTDLIQNYGTTFYQKMYPTHFEYGAINMIIEQAMALASDMCRYFEDVFVVDTRKVEDHVAIGYLKTKFADGYNMYLSRNELMMLLLDTRSCIIYPKRDESYIMTDVGCFRKFFSGVKYTPTYITAENATFYFVLSGIKSRSVPGTCVRGSVKGSKIIDSMIEDNCLNTHTSINYFIELLPKYLGREVTAEEEKSMTLLYKAVDIRTSVAALTSAQTGRMDNSLINLFDQVGLEEINEMMDRESDIINITDLNMNRAHDDRGGSWDWDQEWGFC